MTLRQRYHDLRDRRVRRGIKTVGGFFGVVIVATLVIPAVSGLLGVEPAKQAGKAAPVVPEPGETVPEARARLELAAMSLDQRARLCAEAIATLNDMEPEAVSMSGEVDGTLQMKYVMASGPRVSACRLTPKEVQLAGVEAGRTGRWAMRGAQTTSVTHRQVGLRRTIWVHPYGEGERGWSRDFAMGEQG